MFTVKIYTHNGKKVKTILEGGTIPLSGNSKYFIFPSFQKALEFCAKNP